MGIKIIRIFVVALCLLLAPVLVQAANKYVRQGAAGTASGDDWTNAYTSLPGALVRGNTYYVADGSYSSYTFDDAESGILYITVKKATVADHGTSTGWADSYGDGQATFNSILAFTTGYYVLDGQTRNEGDWFDGAAYGFQVYHNNQDKNITIKNNTAAQNNITVKYVYVNALVGEANSGTCAIASQDCGRYAVDTYNTSQQYHTGLVFQRMYIRGATNHFFIRTTTGTLMEYNALDNLYSNTYNHGEVFNLYFSVDRSISRYNKVRYPMGTAVWAITTCGSSGVCGPSADYNEIYGNVVYNYCVRDAAIGYGGGGTTVAANHTRIYDNTFVDGVTFYGVSNCYGSGVNFTGGGTDNIAYNNVWVTWQAGSLNFYNVTHDYNAFSGTSAFSEAHGQFGLTTSIFTNYATKDFSLSGNTNAGTALASSYNRDLLGSLRGEDGVWDRGAYEYIAGGIISYAVTPSAGANGSMSPATIQTVQSGQTSQFSVIPNSGYTASVGGSCGGILVGNTYTTNPVYANCTVVTTFSQIATFTVTPYAGTGGSISPAVPQTVLSGAYQAITTNASIGYAFASLSLSSGCTGYSSVGNIHSIGPVTGNCTVTANFAATSVMDDGTAAHTLKPTGGGGKLGTGSGFVLK